MVGTVRRARPEDAEGIARLHQQTHREAYGHLLPASVIDGWTVPQRAVIWREMIARDVVAVAEADGEPVGFASVGAPRDEPPVRERELGTIYLLAAHHGTGLGQALLDAVLGDAPASLWVLADNPRARAFYARNGFEPDGVEKDDPTWNGLHEVRLVR